MAPGRSVRRSSRGLGDEVLEKRRKAQMALAGFRKHQADFRAGRLLDSFSDDSELSNKAADESAESRPTVRREDTKKRKRSSIEDTDDVSLEAAKEKRKGALRSTMTLKMVEPATNKRPKLHETVQELATPKPFNSCWDPPPAPRPVKRQPTYKGTARLPLDVKHTPPGPVAGLKRKAELEDCTKRQAAKKPKLDGKPSDATGTQDRLPYSTVHNPKETFPRDSKAGVSTSRRSATVKPSLRRGSDNAAASTGSKRKAGEDEASKPQKKAKIDIGYTPRGLQNCKLTNKYIPMRDKVIPNINISSATSGINTNNIHTRRTTMSKAKLSDNFKGKDILLSAYFGQLLHELVAGDSQDGRAASPEVFAAAFGEIFPDFDGDIQQDPAHFMELLFGRLFEEDMNTATTPEHVPVIEDLFRGEECKKSNCHKCGHEEKKPTPFWTLQLPVKPTFADSIRSVMGPIDQDALMDLVCDECQGVSTRQASTFLSRAPQYLLCQFSRAGRYRKNMEKVELGTQAIDMTVCAPGGHRGVKEGSDYRIDGIVKHRGASMETGHCISQVRDRGRWWTMDDSSASLANRKDVFGDRNGQPYVLFLRRQTATNLS